MTPLTVITSNSQSNIENVWVTGMGRNHQDRIKAFLYYEKTCSLS